MDESRERFKRRSYGTLEADDAPRDEPPFDLWPGEGPEVDSDGWPQTDIEENWNSFQAPIISISAVSSDSLSPNASHESHRKTTPHNKIGSSSKRGVVHDEARDDMEEPRGSNGDLLNPGGTVLTLANAAAASASLGPSAQGQSCASPRSGGQLYKKLPLLLCKRRAKETGSFPIAAESNFIPIDKPTFNARKGPVRIDPTVVVPKRQVVSTTPEKVSKLCFDVDARQAQDSFPARPVSKPGMHSANRLLENKTLPFNTLDFFCRDSGLAAAATPNAWMHRAAAVSEDDTESTSSYYDEEDDEDGDASSLARGVAESKVAKVFFLLNGIEEESSKEPEESEDEEVSNGEAESRSGDIDDITKGKSAYAEMVARLQASQDKKEKSSTPHSMTADNDTTAAGRNEQQETTTKNEEPSFRAEAVSPRIIDSLVNVNALSIAESRDSRVAQTGDEPPARSALSSTKFSHYRPAGRKVANRQKWLHGAFCHPTVDNQKETTSPVKDISTVSGAIEKFGGKTSRKSRVQRRREELEKRAAENCARNGTPKSKITWEMTNGGYKKKVILSSS